MKKFYPLFLVPFFLFLSCKKDENDPQENNPQQNTPSLSNVLTDIDGNNYKTVQIGSQVWMAENLKVSKYRNGNAIPFIEDSLSWFTTKQGAYCYYKNNQSFNNVYGKLYNYYTVNDSRGLCPSGWRVPTLQDWNTLTAYLGGNKEAYIKMKEAGTSHWGGPNANATNSSGFTALPAGNRISSGMASVLAERTLWWSSSEYSPFASFQVSMEKDYEEVLKFYNSKESGFSVRCLKGEQNYSSDTISNPDHKTFRIYTYDKFQYGPYAKDSMKEVTYDDYVWNISVHGRKEDFSDVFFNGSFVFDCNFNESHLEYDNCAYKDGSKDVVILIGYDGGECSSHLIGQPTAFINLGGDGVLWGARFQACTFNLNNSEKRVAFTFGPYGGSACEYSGAPSKVWLYVGIKKSETGKNLWMKSVKLEPTPSF